MKLLTELMQHQKEAVAKMMASRVGALFMEMGTGKTRTSIELIALREHKIDKVVWFCPVSIKENIKREIKKHTGMDSFVFNNKTKTKNIPDSFFNIIGIESMSKSVRVISAANKLITPTTYVIVDESSFIKGCFSARTKWITSVSEKALYRLILTGTPISQGIIDLYAQMKFLSPKILGYMSFYSFAANHLIYSDRFPGMIVKVLDEDYIAARIKPYVFQVTKEQCLDLPDKIYKTHYFYMSDEQRCAYDNAKYEILSKIDSYDFTSYFIFQLFSKLQQIVSGFENITLADKTKKTIVYNNLRTDALMSVVAKIPETEKVIIFAKYEKDILSICESLQNEGYKTVKFYGKMTVEERNNAVDLFKNDARFFIATQQCGGFGLTLNESCNVVFYNNQFKYSERLQAEDRCHRIGQNKKVTYFDIVCIHSIDEKIQESMDKKCGVVESFKNEVDKIKDFKQLKKLIEEL